MDDLDRFYALETRRRSLISTRSEPFEAGIAYFDDDYPERFVSNLLVVPEAQSFRSDQLIASADAILGGAGLPHRLVTVLDDRMPRVSPRRSSRLTWSTARTMPPGILKVVVRS